MRRIESLKLGVRRGEARGSFIAAQASTKMEMNRTPPWT
jgi:hypothetical protein